MHTTVASRASLNPKQWNDAVERHQLGWWWHTSHWIDYSLAYTPDARDASFALLAPGGAILSLVPLVYAPNGKLVMGGQTTPAPLLFLVDTRLAEETEAESRRRGDGHLPLPIQMRPGARPMGTVPLHLKRTLVATHVVDLKQSEADLWKHIRRSYKSLIHKAERDYTISVLSHSSGERAVDVAHKIHVVCAGTETRDARTWELMSEWAAQGRAVVALAVPHVGPALGYAYAIRYKRWAYYASGGSLANDVQHALQWALIKTLRNDGIDGYEMGYDAGPKASEKEKGIVHFKTGFGTVPLGCVVLSAA